MTARARLRAHLKTITPGRRAFSNAIRQTVVLLSDDDLEEELPDILGDASEGDFDFLTFEGDGPEFVKGVEPIAFLGGPGDQPLVQIEGLLLARSARGKLVELFTVATSGTLAPGTEKVVGKSFASLELRAPEGDGEEEEDDE